MKKPFICTLIACAIFLSIGSDEKLPFFEKMEHGADGQHINGEANLKMQTNACISIMSAFCKGSPSSPINARTDIRSEELMKRLKIGTPDQYFEMGFAELRERARAKDIFALLQLAVQYGSENSYLEREKGYDFSISPKDEQLKLFRDAFAAGHVHSASIMASEYAGRGNMEQSYGWFLIAQRLGDKSLSSWGQTEFARISAQNKARGEILAEDYYQLAIARFRQ